MKPAIAWIRDGTLVDRMPENALAFGVAATPLFSDLSFEELVAYAYESSGAPAAAKLHQLSFVVGVTPDAAPFHQAYASLSARIPEVTDYFPGMLDLLEQMRASGIHNYLTTAASEEDLIRWVSGSQGEALKPHISGVLWNAPQFQKKDHLPFLKRKHDPFVYVADAPSEIAMATAADVCAIGMLDRITPDRLALAYDRIKSIGQIDMPAFDPSKVILPDGHAQMEAMRGAWRLVIAPPHERAGDLRRELHDFFYS